MSSGHDHGVVFACDAVDVWICLLFVFSFAVVAVRVAIAVWIMIPGSLCAVLHHCNLLSSTPWLKVSSVSCLVGIVDCTVWMHRYNCTWAPSPSFVCAADYHPCLLHNLS